MREDEKIHPDPGAVELDRRLQADPELNEGRATTTQKVLTVIAAIAVVVLVMYGLTNQRDATQRETASTPATQTTGAAPPAGPQEGKQQADQPQGQAQGSQGPGNASPRDTTGAAPKPPAGAPKSSGAAEKQK